MRGISVFAGVALALLVVASSAQAQGLRRQWRLCGNDDSERSIDACSAIIESGRKTQTEKILAEAYTYRGNSYADKGETAKAIADYDQAIKHDPTRDDAFAGRGVQYYSLHDYQHAKQDLDAAIRLDPDSALVWAWRSRAKQRLGDTSGANADMLHAHSLDPDVENDLPDTE